MQQLYDKWLTYLFDRPETPESWYLDLDVGPFEAEDQPALMVELFMQTCLHSGHDLARFSDKQIADGLCYIFFNYCADAVYALQSTDLPVETRIQCIYSIEALYQQCFSKRCLDETSYYNKEIGNPLNNFCFMLWDVTPLRNWEGAPDKDRLYAAVVSLLRRCLDIPHLACIESALHGLAHVHVSAKAQAQAAIDEWLMQSPALPPKLLQYAQDARIGNVL